MFLPRESRLTISKSPTYGSRDAAAERAQRECDPTASAMNERSGPAPVSALAAFGARSSDAAIKAEGCGAIVLGAVAA